MTLDSKLGIADQDYYYGVQFNEPTNTLILQTGRKFSNYCVRSLYCRSINDEKYIILAHGDSVRTYEEPIVSSKKQYVYANVFTFNRPTGNSTDLVHQTWESIVRIDIDKCEVKNILSNKSPIITNNDLKTWITHLISLGADDDYIIIIMATMPINGKRREVQYDLCKYIFDTENIEKISSLEAGYF